jgi:hypothetical protein
VLRVVGASELVPVWLTSRPIQGAEPDARGQRHRAVDLNQHSQGLD